VCRGRSSCRWSVHSHGDWGWVLDISSSTWHHKVDPWLDPASGTASPQNSHNGLFQRCAHLIRPTQVVNCGEKTVPIIECGYSHTKSHGSWHVSHVWSKLCDFIYYVPLPRISNCHFDVVYSAINMVTYCTFQWLKPQSLSYKCHEPKLLRWEKPHSLVVCVKHSFLKKITSPGSARLDQAGWSAAAGSQLIRFYHRLDTNNLWGHLGVTKKGNGLSSVETNLFEVGQQTSNVSLGSGDAIICGFLQTHYRVSSPGLQCHTRSSQLQSACHCTQISLCRRALLGIWYLSRY